MVAFFGLGIPELIILALLAIFLVGTPIVVLAVVFLVNRRSTGMFARSAQDAAPSVAELQAEICAERAKIEQLRAEIARLKQEPPSTGMTRDAP